MIRGVPSGVSLPWTSNKQPARPLKDPKTHQNPRQPHNSFQNMARQQQSGPWGSCPERWATFSITLAFSLTLRPPQKMAAAEIQHMSTALTPVLLLLVPWQALSELLWASPCLLPLWVPRCWPKALHTRCLGSASIYPGWFESQNNGNYITALPPS